MSKTLQDRLHDAKVVLAQVHAALERHSTKLPREVEISFRALVDYRTDIDHWLGMLEARAAACRLLDALETQADADDCVPLGAARVQYQHVRFIGVQAYVTTNWALADRIAVMVGRILCTPEAGLNGVNPAQLISHFVTRDKIRRTTAAARFESVRQAFGWPIGLSYAIRNHFVHDGAQIGGSDFFEGPSAASAFRISPDGWDRVEQKVEAESRVDRSCHRAGASWPSTPQDDLRIVLAVCEREMDDALGVLSRLRMWVTAGACGLHGGRGLTEATGARDDCGKFLELPESDSQDACSKRSRWPT